MRFDIEPPKNSKDFEHLCLVLLRRHWASPQLQLYAHDGESQDGVDIYDPYVSCPHRAGQCKLHDQSRTIPPEEIREEVAKALLYDPPLNQYIILTTGRKSKFADDAVKAINQQHRAQKLFTVEVLTWDRIEELLDQYSDVRDSVYKTIPGQAVEQLRTQLHDIHATISAVMSGPNPDALDAELDSAKDWLEEHKPSLARQVAERVLSRHGDRLSHRQKWRAQTFVAAAHLADGELRQAGRILVDAGPLQPGDEKARANEAVGYELLGDLTRARALAEAARQTFPTSGPVLAVWIRTAELMVPIEYLESEAGVLAENDQEVAVALAVASFPRNQPLAAERFARVATQLRPKAFHGWYLLAQALHYRGQNSTRIAERTKLLEEAHGHYTLAVELGTSQGPRHLLAASYLNRGVVLEQIGQHEEAGDDFREAMRLEGTAAHVLGQYAVYLFLRERYNDAVDFAGRAARASGDGQFDHLLAAAFYNRHHPGDQEQAIELWCRVVRRGPGELFRRALVCAIRSLCLAARSTEARTLLAAIQPAHIPPAVLLAHQAAIHLAEDDVDTARDLARRAVAAVDTECEQEDRLAIAMLTHRLGLFAEIVQLLTPISYSGSFDQIARLYLDGALVSGNHGLFLRVCRELRESGVVDARLRKNEAEVLSRYDPRRAAELLADYLSDSPDDRIARLQLALLGRECEEPSWSVNAPEELPSPADSDPATVGRAAIRVLLEEGRPMDALRFAYDSLRSHPNDPDANLSYLTLFFEVDDEKWATPPNKVGPDAAVHIRDVVTGKEEWVVIESDEPNPLLGEFAIDHPRVRRMLGKGAGDRFLLVPGIGNRDGEIIELRNKYFYRFELCRDNYQTQFQERRDFQMVRVVHERQDGSEQIDLAPILADLSRQRDYVTGLMEHYRANPTPLHVFSNLVGCDLFETMDGLCQTPQLEVNCWNGNPSEIKTSAELLLRNCTLILETTSLFTLGRLGLLDCVRAFPGVTLVVTQGVFNQLRNLAARTLNRRSRGHVFAAGDGQVGFLEVPEQEAQTEQDFREGLVSWVRLRCKVVPCLELAELPPERRRRLVDLFGSGGAESVCLATRPDHVLFTDDFTLEMAARGFDLCIRRTWTQAVLLSALEFRALGSVGYADAIAKLIGWGYTATQFSPEVLHRAAIMAYSGASRQPFTQTLRYFGRPDVPRTMRMVMAGAFLFTLDQCEASQFIVESATAATLNNLPREAVRAIVLALTGTQLGGSLHRLQQRVDNWLRRSKLGRPGGLP